MALVAFGEVKKEYGTRKELFNLWYELSPKSFAIIKENNEPVGYCIVFPVNRLTFRKYVNGRISLYQFDDNNINPNQDSNTTHYVYLHSAYLKSSCRQNPIIFLRLINAIYLLAGRFVNQKKPSDNILFTEGVSSYGQELIKKFGFARFEDDNSFDGYPIYHLDFSNLDRHNHKFRKRARVHLRYLIRKTGPNSDFSS